MQRAHEYILRLSCRDTTGIVHAVSGLLYQGGCNIVDSQQSGDVDGDDATGLFCMRVHFRAPPQLSDVATLERLFGHARQQFGMTLAFRALVARPLTPVSNRPDRVRELRAVPPQGAQRSLGPVSAGGVSLIARQRLPNGHKTVVLR
jgi:formyltetrahydrofolate deformylase